MHLLCEASIGPNHGFETSNKLIEPHGSCFSSKLRYLLAF
jgi:hypothetical protein